MECLWKAWHMLCQARLVIPQHTVVVAKPFLLIGLHWLHQTLNSRPFFPRMEVVFCLDELLTVEGVRQAPFLSLRCRLPSHLSHKVSDNEPEDRWQQRSLGCSIVMIYSIETGL